MNIPDIPNREPDYKKGPFSYWFKERIMCNKWDTTCHFNPNNWTFYNHNSNKWIELYLIHQNDVENAYLRWLATESIEKEFGL